MDFDKLIEYRNIRHGFARHTGIHVTKITSGYAEGEISIDETHLNPMGTVHGGLIFSLMDIIGGSAAISRGNLVTTSSSHILFISAGQNTKKLRAVAKEIKAGRTLIDVDVEVFDDRDALIAKATMVYFRLPQTIDELLDV